MQRNTHATTPSAVKLETSAREQQVDAPGQVALQNKGAKHFISHSSEKTKPLDCSCHNPFNTPLTSHDGLKWQLALQANGCTVKCLSHSSVGKKKRGNHSMPEVKVKTAGWRQLQGFFFGQCLWKLGEHIPCFKHFNCLESKKKMFASSPMWAFNSSVIFN